jgi:hypothetical protein
MKLLKFVEKAGGREVLSKVLRPSFKLEIVRVKRKRYKNKWPFNRLGYSGSHLPTIFGANLPFYNDRA